MLSVHIVCVEYSRVHTTKEPSVGIASELLYFLTNFTLRLLTFNIDGTAVAERATVAMFRTEFHGTNVLSCVWLPNVKFIMFFHNNNDNNNVVVFYLIVRRASTHSTTQLHFPSFSATTATAQPFHRLLRILFEFSILLRFVFALFVFHLFCCYVVRLFVFRKWNDFHVRITH